ncbi:hypothetical protein ASPBRDRAFT_420328 [Aspergillus brasiliensis CBS 101740]|uniref:Uncharacterized protein n=1 Tax=Aspergillus brasiliensis (strain CBS 101740 / IMI 381727 / IBT 21946) TaxID=767769 RepID=A0A1L9U4H0_ASPBC|nr:hypothetical protein ASPBRDRAFT_420328 [Aspergillus brasiliensis CBS 101740]
MSVPLGMRKPGFMVTFSFNKRINIRAADVAMTSRAPKKSIEREGERENTKKKKKRIFEKGTGADLLQGDQFSWRHHLAICITHFSPLPDSQTIRRSHTIYQVVCSIFAPNQSKRRKERKKISQPLQQVSIYILHSKYLRRVHDPKRHLPWISCQAADHPRCDRLVGAGLRSIGNLAFWISGCCPAPPPMGIFSLFPPSCFPPQLRISLPLISGLVVRSFFRALVWLLR